MVRRTKLLDFILFMGVFLYGIMILISASVFVFESEATQEPPVLNSSFEQVNISIPIIKYEDIKKEVDDIIEASKPVKNIQKINYSFNVFMPSNYTRDDLIRMLGNRTGFIPYVDYFIEVEKTYGVNSLYLMATLGLESGWGKYRANTNNIAGWKATSTTFRSFPSVQECINTVARGLNANYRPRGTDIVTVTKRYCPTPGYTDKVLVIMKELQRNY